MGKATRLRPHGRSRPAGATQSHAQERALAGRKFDAAVATLLPVVRMPARGSPRLGQLCEIPGLRCWRVADLPMQWLYVEAADQLDVVRMLDDQQDIVALMTTSDWVGGMP